ncbi:MAG: hypothetical protein JSU07_08615 [Bacteroidetes bacterium]|nr:hypothetical protein [Bacteroidota bacterium]
MRKILITITLAVSAITGAYAQNAFEKGTNMLGAYVGLGSRYSFNTIGTGYSSSATPWLGVTFDNGTFGLPDPKMTISIGGMIGFQHASQSWQTSYYDQNSLSIVNATDSWSYNFITLGPRGAFHYTWEKAEVYGGLMIGYSIVSSKFSSTYANAGTQTASAASGVGYGLFAGGRYLFTKGFGVYGELGYGTSYLNIGLCFKL